MCIGLITNVIRTPFVACLVNFLWVFNNIYIYIYISIPRFITSAGDDIELVLLC